MAISEEIRKNLIIGGGFGGFQDPFNLPPAAKPPQGKLDAFLGSPGGSMLMNLLAQSGYSTMPQSPFGAIGRAALMTQQQQQQRGMSDLQRRLLESRIGLNEYRVSQGVNPQAGNVQSTFKGDNGNMWVFTRGSTTPIDTGVKFDSSIKTFELDDGSVVGIDADGNRIGTLVTPQEAAEATTRATQTEKLQNLPTELAALDAIIAASDRVVQKIDDIEPLTDQAGLPVAIRGDLPGPLGGDPRRLKQEAQSLKANFGFDTLQKMRAASKTGGALGQVSERELDLLINALQAIDVEGEPQQLRENLQKVKTHYRNYKREIEIMKNAMRSEAGQATSAPAKNVEDMNVEDMTEEQLREIIRRGNAD